MTETLLQRTLSSACKEGANLSKAVWFGRKIGCHVLFSLLLERQLDEANEP